MPVQTAGLRERKKEQTRDAIVAAAWALFSVRGYDSVTAEEIAEAAGVSRRTFFRYFPAKEAVVFPHERARLARFRELLAEGGSGFDAVGHACLGLARVYMEHRDETVAQHRIVESTPSLVVRERELDRRWEEAVAEALREGSSAAAARRARVLGAAVFGAIRATLSEWFDRGGQGDLVRMGRETLDLLRQGFGGRPAAGNTGPRNGR